MRSTTTNLTLITRGANRRVRCWLAAATLAGLPGVCGAVTVASNPSSTWPTEIFSPYIAITQSPTPQLGSVSTSSGIKYYTLAFINADTSNTSIASWEGLNGDPIASSATSGFGLDLINGINAVRAAGGDVMPSFGGANGTPIDSTITSTSALQAQYQTIINTYHFDALDFDIEGSWVTDTASNTRRWAALAPLEAANPNLKIWLTLPINPTGLPAAELSIVTSALAAGVKISGVNTMAFDYGDSNAPNPAGMMGTYAVEAADAAHIQLMTAFNAAGNNYTDAQVWAMQGLTSMIGVNDHVDEIFNLTDEQQLLTFARQKGLGSLSFWSVTRDHPGTDDTQAYSTNSGLSQTDYQFSQLQSAYAGIAPTSCQWVNAAGGTWGTFANWSVNSIADGPAAVATISGLSASSSITIDGTRTVGQLVLNNATPINISGGTLAINNTGAATAAGISILAGTHVMSSPIVLTAGATVSTVANTSLTLNGIISGAGGLSLTGSGALTLSAAETFIGSTTVTGGTLTLSSTGRLPVGSAVTVSSGGSVVQTRNHSSAITVVPLGSITLDSTSKFDLTGDDLVLSSTTLSTVNAAVSAGFRGNWIGPGLVSSWAATDTTHLTTIGVMQNNQSGSALYSSSKKFDGYSPGIGDVLVKYTYFGDTDLNGKVDGSDYSRIDNAYASRGTLTGWFNGDFNYDGVINGSDYTLIDNAFNTQRSQLDSEAADPNASVTAEISAVPEPATSYALAFASIALLGRRSINPVRTRAVDR